MLMVISPAKTLDYKSTPPVEIYTQPDYLPQAQQLIDILKHFNPAEIAQLMHISDPLAVLNAQRFIEWQRPFTTKNSKQAIFAFMGDVYEGLDAQSLDHQAVDYAQRHLRILSGLYGLLRPLDLMQAYRLEMGTKLMTPKGKNLYAFWGNLITEALNQALVHLSASVLVNLASEEYFKAVQRPLIKAKIITPVFEEYKNGGYKIISFYTKRARGLMTRYVLQHQINEVEALKDFTEAGYIFSPIVSDEIRWVFRR